PIPEPAVEDDRGNVLASLSTPLGGGGDRMRKFVWSEGRRAITFLVVRRSDGALTAALDLCEICQPRGYAQMGRGYVFCKYCKTPIPVDAVGQPGGCNPVPLPEATVKGSLLVVPRAALLAARGKGLKVPR
ncbi:MAG TPA: Fe-S-containing protein, partial [Anaeromyxobacteraceae bacterium]|nr:Fe-S-containing protein [Anaeromyxobacteraceae bacterium]